MINELSPSDTHLGIFPDSDLIRRTDAVAAVRSVPPGTTCRGDAIIAAINALPARQSGYGGKSSELAKKLRSFAIGVDMCADKRIMVCGSWITAQELFDAADLLKQPATTIGEG